MSKRKSIQEIKDEFKSVHGNKYDYSLITEENYINTKTKLPIICHCYDEWLEQEHSVFYQDRNHHLRGHGCPKCAKMGIKYTNEEFIKKVKKLNKDLLLDKCVYVNAHTNIEIGCIKHGYFTLKPYLLLQGHGCPKGEQHFIDKGIFGDFENIIHRDKIKFQLCEKNNIKLIYYFPAEFLRYNVSFYKDKIVFNTINELKEYYDKIR